MQPPHVLFASLLALALFGVSARLSAQTPPPSPPVERVVVNRIVAIIDRDVVTLRELQRRVEPLLKRLASVAPDKRAAAEARLYRDVLDQIIDDRLIGREARALKISVTSTEINAAIDAVAASKKVTREQVIQLVVEQGFTEVEYREQLVRQLLVGKLVRVKMADKLKQLDKDPQKAMQQMEALERAYVQGLRAGVYLEVRL